MVQTWLRLQQAIGKKELMAVLKPWIAELMKKMINFGFTSNDPTFVESDIWSIFLYYTQKGDQHEIHGKEAGLVVIGLMRLKKITAGKI